MNQKCTKKQVLLSWPKFNQRIHIHQSICLSFPTTSLPLPSELVYMNHQYHQKKKVFPVMVVQEAFLKRHFGNWVANQTMQSTFSSALMTLSHLQMHCILKLCFLFPPKYMLLKHYMPSFCPKSFFAAGLNSLKSTILIL